MLITHVALPCLVEYHKAAHYRANAENAVAKLIRFFKPFRVLSQFTDADGRRDAGPVHRRTGVYRRGDSTYDSEGLLLLTDDGACRRESHTRSTSSKKCIRSGRRARSKTHARSIDAQASCCATDSAERHAQQADWSASRLPPRDPPIPPRHRESQQLGQQSFWTRAGIGRCAGCSPRWAIRCCVWSESRIGPWTLDDLAPGEWNEEAVHLPR